MVVNKMLIIKCPHCQAEYLPAEIFIPDAFMGKPSQVSKDSKGIIQDYVGTDMDLSETYRCDYCNRKFNVDAVLKFNTSSNTRDFNNTYATKLTKSNLFLDED